ncbi:MAG: hypothetical protein JWN50_388 [Parcubacteria group bacterium]|nr:hypothetical protein [Parcubacteria group bacterium]
MPKRGQTVGDILFSTGLILNSGELWGEPLRASKTWPKERKCLIGLPGVTHLPQDNKMSPVENFREYSFEEAHRWLKKELEPRPELSREASPDRATLITTVGGKPMTRFVKC